MGKSFMEPASFIDRLVAFIVDSIITSLGISVILIISSAILIALVSTESAAAIGVGVVMFLISLLIAVAIQFCYFGYFWSEKGKTIGMGMMNIRVVTNEGGNMSFAMAGFRGTVGYYVSSFVFYLGFLWMLFDDNQQTWHDLMFGTQVVKA